MPPTDPESAAWFSAEIQPHEPMLRAWLRSQFPKHAAEIDDIVQEAYARVLNTRQKGPIRAPKAFVFAIARNLVITQLRRQTLAPHVELDDFLASSILDEGTDVPHAVARAQELSMLTEAIQTLPTRCRQILTLRKIYGLSLRETAAELGITEHTVVIQATTGLRKLRAFFQARSDSNPPEEIP